MARDSRRDSWLRYAVATCLSAAVLLGTPAPAEAGWKIDRATKIADIVFGEPACGVPALYWSEDRPNASAGEWVTDGVCSITFDAGNQILQDFEPFCSVLLHGMGHLHGLEHSSNPRSVMRPYMHFQERLVWSRDRYLLRWFGIDQRCRDRGRPYLEKHGAIPARSKSPRRSPSRTAPAGSG